MGNPKQILLLFSDIKTAELINTNLLAPAGHEVTITSNQENAINSVNFQCPNLIILSDIQEGKDPIELIKSFLINEPTLAIIYLSNKSSEIKSEDFLHTGYVEIIKPPFKQEKLREAISQGLKRNEIWLNWLNNYSKTSNEKKSFLILDQLENGIVTINDQGEITFLNNALRKALNLPMGTHFGESIEDVFLDPSWLEVLKGINSSADIIEVTGANKRVYQVRITEILSNEKLVSFFDITELKKLYKVKTEYVNTASHDLRSPLTSIFGYIDLIQRIGGLNEEQQKYIDKVNISAHNINSLIDDILSLGKTEIGKIDKMELLAICPIIKESIDAHIIQAENRKQSLNFTYDDQIPDIPGDPIQLRKMIDNLVGNAIKYTQDGGEISVSVTSKREIVSIVVKDNGAGIPKEEQQKIFEKFYRAKDVNPESPGTGLGLTITKSVVDNHHGRIKVQSDLGKGSSFTVLLPAFI